MYPCCASIFVIKKGTMRLVYLLTVALLSIACASEIETGGGGTAGASAEPEECPAATPLWFEDEGRCVECIRWQDCESETCAGGTCIPKPVTTLGDDS